MTREPLRKYQITGAQFLVTRDRALLGDDTGLGKSAQAIAAAEVRGAGRILVLCPAIGRVSWSKEFPKWQDRRPVVLYAPGLKSIPAGDVALIVTFDTLSRAASKTRLRNMLERAEEFEAVVIDEAHYLKSPTSNRTKAVYGARLDLKSCVLTWALREPTKKSVWIMSATIQKANALDLWPHLRALFPDVLEKVLGSHQAASKDAFIAMFCNTHEGDYGPVIDGNNAVTMPRLIDAMKPHTLIRRKRDVAPELGSVNRVLLPLDVTLPEPEPLQIHEQHFLDGWEHTDTPTVPPPSIMERWRDLGEAKIEPAAAWIKDFLEADPDRKLVVFAHHRAVIEGLVGKFPHEAVSLYGGTSPKQRQISVDRLQSDQACRLFVGQTLAAGTSITLTASSTVLVLEPEWAPTDTYQAISRVHRLGQDEPVTAYFGYAAGTVDERIAAVARRKDIDTAQFLNGLAAQDLENNN